MFRVLLTPGNYDGHVRGHKMKLVRWLVYFDDFCSVLGNLLLLVFAKDEEIKTWTTTQMTRVCWSQYFRLRGKGNRFYLNLGFYANICKKEERY